MSKKPLDRKDNLSRKGNTSSRREFFGVKLRRVPVDQRPLDAKGDKALKADKQPKGDSETTGEQPLATSAFLLFVPPSNAAPAARNPFGSKSPSKPSSSASLTAPTAASVQPVPVVPAAAAVAGMERRDSNTFDKATNSSGSRAEAMNSKFSKSPSSPAAPPFAPMVGVSLEFLRKFMRDHQHHRFADFSMTDVCSLIIIPETKQRNCAFVDLFTGLNDPNDNPYVGPATVYVSHAWKGSIGEAIDVMAHYETLAPNSYFWFDIFVINQNVSPDLPPEWCSTTLKMMIRQIGAMLVVASPWQQPLFYTRAWCLWELYCGVMALPGRVYLQMPSHVKEDFVAGVLDNPDAMAKGLEVINADTAEAFLKRDKDMLVKAFRSAGGAAAVTKAVKACVRDWYVHELKQIAEFETDLSPEAPDFKENVANLGSTVNEIGFALDSLGMSDDALQYYQDGLDLSIRAKGPDHRDLAVMYNNIGSVLSDRKEYARAIEMYEKALAIDLAAKGAYHLETAETYSNLAVCYAHKGEHDMAVDYYEKALAIRLSKPKPTNHETAINLASLGSEYRDKGLYDKAIRHFDQALSMHVELDGPNHPDTATSCYDLGACYGRKGEHEQSLKLQERALNIRITALGANHPDTAASFYNLGLTHEHSGSRNPIERIYFLKAAEIFLATLGPDDPRTKAARDKIASNG